MLLVLGGAIYFILLVTLGLMTFRKGHFILFWVGIIFPLLWVIGAIKRPVPAYRGGTA